MICSWKLQGLKEAVCFFLNILSKELQNQVAVLGAVLSEIRERKSDRTSL
jgi:flavin reductase (DIM6/NTAB) family NADH-FMN oxidoreductase RutF